MIVKLWIKDKGLIELAKRSGVYKKIIVMPVKKGELISIDKFDEEIVLKMIENDELREATETIGYYCKIVENSGFEKWLYWTKEKMEFHADTYSPAFNLDAHKKIISGKMDSKELWKYSSFWYKSFDDMALKTMLRQIISKWGQMSTELQEAIVRDEEGTYEKSNTFDYDLKADVEKNANKETLDLSGMVELPTKEEPKDSPPPKVDSINNEALANASLGQQSLLEEPNEDNNELDDNGFVKEII